MSFLSYCIFLTLSKSANTSVLGAEVNKLTMMLITNARINAGNNS